MLGSSPPEYNKEQDIAIDAGREDNSFSTNGEETWDSVFSMCTTIGLKIIAVLSFLHNNT